MDYKENPPKNFKDQLFIEDLVNNYIDLVGMRQRAKTELVRVDALPYSMEAYAQGMGLRRAIEQCNETIAQLNMLLKARKIY